MRRFLLASVLAVSPFVHAERLTVDRLFSDPDLNGPSPRALKIAPDGSRVTFLRGRADDQNQLDLWEYEVASGKARRLVDSTALGEAQELSDAEKARRERERIAQLKGIVAYRWAPDSRKLLFSVGERLWLYDLDAKPGARIACADAEGLRGHRREGIAAWRLCLVRQPAEPVHDRSRAWPQLSAHPRRRGPDPQRRGRVRRAGGNGSRPTGYWWAPDDSAIAFERYDESAVDEVKRTEVYADRTETISQRYPAAGTAERGREARTGQTARRARRAGSISAPTRTSTSRASTGCRTRSGSASSAKAATSDGWSLIVVDTATLRETHAADRDQPDLDRPQRRSAFPEERRCVRVGLRTRRLQASVCVRTRRKVAAQR